MERTYINEAQKAIGGTVKVQGFIENLRNSKYMAFIVLKDITGKLQITVEKADHPELVDTIDQLTPDSVITVTGKVMENDYVKMGGVEMIPESIEVESTANALPIVRKEIAATKKKKAVERSSIDQRIDYRWIDLRTDENQLMFKAQSTTSTATLIWHRAPSSISRWLWLPALSVSSRPVLCSALRRATPTSTLLSSPASIWSSATSPPSKM